MATVEWAAVWAIWTWIINGAARTNVEQLQ